MLTDFIVNGLIAGGIYALIALGYTMVYGVLKFINFAHGEIYMVGAYLALTFVVSAGMPILVAVILAIALTACLGVLVEVVAYRPLLRFSRLAPLISSIGVSIILRNIVAIFHGSGPKSLRPSESIREGYKILGASITPVQVTIILTSLVLVFLLDIFFSKTKLGKIIRATSEDRELVNTLGIDSRKVISFVFALGSALAAVGGILVALDQDLIPSMGILAGFKGFTVSIIGGIGNIRGAMVGGIFLGLLENLVAGYLSTGFKDAVSFILLVLFVTIKPQGFFGEAVREA